MKYKVEYNDKSVICTRDEIEKGNYDIVSCPIAKTQILIVFNDLIFFRAMDVHRGYESRPTYEKIGDDFNICIECIPDEETVNP
jgi:hypothetical protein